MTSLSLLVPDYLLKILKAESILASLTLVPCPTHLQEMLLQGEHEKAGLASFA